MPDIRTGSARRASDDANDQGASRMATRRMQAAREEYRVPGLPEPISHYTDAVRFGDLLHISGVAPLDADGRLVGGRDPAAQTRQIMVNLQKILAAAGAGFRDVLKVTVYLTDVNDRHAINPVRQEFFGDARPASTLIGISKLAIPGMKVEIEAVAGIPRRPARKAATRKAPVRRATTAAAGRKRAAKTAASPARASRTRR